MLVAGLQFGHVVGQVDVHVLDEVRPVLVGQPQMYHVESGRRVTVVGHVLLLLLLIVVVVVVAVLQLLSAVHVLLDLGRHERAEAVRLRRRHELHLAGRGPEPPALR